MSTSMPSGYHQVVENVPLGHRFRQNDLLEGHRHFVPFICAFHMQQARLIYDLYSWSASSLQEPICSFFMWWQKTVKQGSSAN